MFSFKEKLANKIIDKICPIGERAQELCHKEEVLLDILEKGAADADKVAKRTMTLIKSKLSLLHCSH